jgi:hypothetical protein
MIARLTRTQADFATRSHPQGDWDSEDWESSRVMGRVSADYDRGILTLRGTVRTFRERQFAQDAYTALAERQPVLNLIRVVGATR